MIQKAEGQIDPKGVHSDPRREARRGFIHATCRNTCCQLNSRQKIPSHTQLRCQQRFAECGTGGCLIFDIWLCVTVCLFIFKDYELPKRVAKNVLYSAVFSHLNVRFVPLKLFLQSIVVIFIENLLTS